MAVASPRQSARSEAADAADKTLSRRVLVTIRRDQTTETPRVVWQHEIPILQLIWGKDEVKEQDPKLLDEGYTTKVSADMLPHNKRQDVLLPPSVTSGIGHVFIGHPQAEFDRLVAAYGKHTEINQPNVEFVYGRFSTGQFAQMLGRPALADLPDTQLRDLILGYGFALPVATKDSTPAEQREASEAWTKFRALDTASLVKLAAEVGVEIG